MAEPFIGPLPAGTKRCRVCAEPINANARVCINCSSYQGWFSGLGISTSVLAVLTALISVATVAIPILQNAITPKNSSLTFSLQGASSDVISILVTNSGIRPGTVGEGVLWITDQLPFKEGDPQVRLRIYGGGVSSGEIIEPGKSALINYELVKDEPAPIESFDAYNMNCDLDILSTSFVGYINSEPVTLRSWDEDGQESLNSCQKLHNLFEKQLPLFPKNLKN
jgi:hypothetical protein